MFKSIISVICAVCALTPCVAALSPTSEQSEQPRYGADFQGGNFLYDEAVSITYDHKVIDEYVNPYGITTFATGRANDCALSLGGNSLVYYDRLHENLIPNYTYEYIWGEFQYGVRNSEINNMFDELYDLMGCTASGTTIPGFKNGMTAYCQNRNVSISFPNATGSFYNLNYDYIKQQLRQEKLVAVFVNGFSFVYNSAINYDTGKDDFSYAVLSNRHSVIVYGYKDIYYYNANNELIRHNTYFCSSTGYQMPDKAYLTVDVKTTFEDAYIINIA